MQISLLFWQKKWLQYCSRVKENGKRKSFCAKVWVLFAVLFYCQGLAGVQDTDAMRLVRVFLVCKMAIFWVKANP